MTVHIGGERQLFLDDHVTEGLDGLERVLQRPSKLDRPVLEGDEPWERSTAAIIGNSLHHDEDEGLFKAWYDTAAGVAHATSRDGLQWEKPRLGILEHDGSTANNLVSPGRNFSVVKDPREGDPSRRYKAMYWHTRRDPEAPWGGKGHFVAYSPDGVHWTPEARNPVADFRNGLTDGQFVLGWDAAHGKYVAYMRPSVWFFEPDKRTSAWVASDDFIDWGPAVLAVAPDESDAPGVEYYRMTVAKYEGIYLGFIWVYHNDEVEFADQSRNTVLAMSRNGITWRKPFGSETFLETGEAGEWDSRWAGVCNMIPMEDELRLYYSGANIPHNILAEGGGRGSVRDWPGRVIDGERRAYAVGLARLRRDGFVALRPRSGEGTLTTRPLTFLGTRLHLNVDSSAGSVEVEVTDEGGEPLEGYSRGDCVPISTDSTDVRVKWRGDRDLVHGTDTAADLGGDQLAFRSRLRKPVRLRFHLRDASLYSFRIG